MRILQPVNLCKTKFSPKWNLLFYLTYNSIVDLIEGSNIRSKDEILEYADYVSRLDFYCMELTLSKKDTKELKDIKLDCVREHKSAIDKVTSFSMDKYLIAK